VGHFALAAKSAVIASRIQQRGLRSVFKVALQQRPCLVVCLLSLLMTDACLAAPGDLDTTFNGSGKVTTLMGTGPDYGRAVAIQSDGKILLAGSASIPTYRDFTLLRYNANGSLDTNFNGTGKVTTPMSSYDDYGRGIAVQGDGKILVAGYAGSAYVDFALARYETNGTLDTTFNSTGRIITPVGTGDDCGQSVALQADQRILVAGYARIGTNYDFALVRYETNGSLDASFNGSGKVTTAIGTSDDCGQAVAIQTDGRIVVAGYAMIGTNLDFALVRYQTDGSLDTSFNGTGKVTTPMSSYDDCGQSVVIQGDGKILVAGYAWDGGFNRFALARYNSNGTLDTNFNGNGKVTTIFNGYDDRSQSLALQSDGKILVAGYASNGYYDYFAVARYNPNGSLDTSFNGSGKVTTHISSYDDWGASVAVQGDGNILVAGSANSHLALVRYWGGDVEIAIEQPAGRDLVDGASGVDFGPTLTTTTSDRTFTIKNARGGSLTGLGVIIDGSGAGNFSVIESPVAPVTGPTGSTTFAVRFAPTTGGPKTASMRIASNDSDENPFDIDLIGRGLVPSADEDSDGITNEAEIALKALGFDPLIDSTALRTVTRDNCLALDLYRASDMQTLALGSPLLERDIATGQFHLIVGVDRSSDLKTWAPLSGFSPMYDEPNGLIDIGITPDGSNPQFFRVIGGKP